MLQWTVLRSNIGTSVKNKARARRQSQVPFLAKILPFLQPMLTESAFLKSIQTGELEENPVKGCSFKNLGLSMKRLRQIMHCPEQSRFKTTAVLSRPESNPPLFRTDQSQTTTVPIRPESKPPPSWIDQSQNHRRPEKARVKNHICFGLRLLKAFFAVFYMYIVQCTFYPTVAEELGNRKNADIECIINFLNDVMSVRI